MRVQGAIEIDAPPEKVWPFFVEPEKVLQWSSSYRRFEYTSDQRCGVGTPVYVEEQTSGPLVKAHFKAVEWKDNEKLTWQMVSGSGVKSYQQFWSLEPTPSGSRFTFLEEVELPLGMAGKFIGLIGQSMARAALHKMLLRLKALAEA